MSFFSVDGGFYKFLSRFWDMIKLNFCWLVFSLPIVTIGASTVAAYSVTLKMIDDSEGYICRSFWKAFKQNLKQGIPLGLIFMFLCYVIWFSFYNFITLDSVVLLIGGIIVTFVTFLSFLYAFALSARYENTLLRTIKNSFDISVRYFGHTLFLLVILAVEVFLFLWISEKFVRLFIILFGPGCFMLTISGFAMKHFREIERTGGVMPSKGETDDTQAEKIDEKPELTEETENEEIIDK